MTKNDFDMLVAEIESRAAARMQAAMQAAKAEIVILHAKMDGLHDKMASMIAAKTAEAAPPPPPGGHAGA